MSSTDPPVVIVGGGPVGLTMALGLAHHGVRSALVEQDPSTPRESRTLNLWARVLEMFRDWAIADDLMAAGTFMQRLQPLDATTDRRLFTMDLSVLGRVSPLPGVLMIPQNITEEVLRSAVAAEPACQLVTGRCTGVEQTDEQVSVQLETSDGPRSIRAAYCVGADGAHSTVRRAMNVPMEGETHPQRMMLSDETIHGTVRGHMRFAIRTPGFHVALKFGGHSWRVMSSIPESTPDAEATSAAAVDERVRQLFGEVGHTTEWISTFSVHRRIAERYRIGRVLLVGDAAHLISPIGGQGMNCGMLDAENLSWKLAAVLAGGSNDTLLDSYHAERHWAMTSKISRNAGDATEAEISQPPAMKRIMIRVIGGVLAIRPLRAKIAGSLSMLELRYPSSQVFLGDHPMVGGRLSDLPHPDGGRLSDWLRGNAAVLFVNGATEFPVDGATVLSVSKAPRSWKLRKPAAVVVRPDRHVAAVLPHASSSEVETAMRVALGHS